jgi:D-beta-D-heptose 7-phosphate kinase/D-beta-D-heptose 1-phosphate adenosyltransferase
VVEEAELLAAVRAARARGERLVMTNGCFDILHAGHVTYLEQAARLGDRLIVAVNADDQVSALKGPGRPVNPLAQRMRVLAALGCVDWVVSFAEPTPERLICALRPDLLVKGGDNDPLRVPGGDCVRAAGGEVRVLDYLDGISTTAILRSIQGA